VSLRSIDFPAVTILGWTPTDDQWVAAIAVVAGAAGALVLMAGVRKTRKLVFGIVLGLAVVLVWSWLRR
jgi:uncharacterized membrane protein YsdA (DUF1294 family)